MGISVRELFQVVKNTYIFLVGLLDKEERKDDRWGKGRKEKKIGRFKKKNMLLVCQVKNFKEEIVYGIKCC